MKILVLMSKKSNTNVLIAATVSRIRTKQSVTKIRCICAAIPGLALHSRAIQPLFTHLQLDQTRQMPVDTVVRISLAPVSLHRPRVLRWL